LLPGPCPSARGFAVGPFGEPFYAGHTRLNLGTDECEEEVEEGVPPATTIAKLAGSGKSLINELDRANSTAVAADLSIGRESSGDVYVNNMSSIAAFNSSGSPVQRFGSGQLSQGSGLAVNARENEVFATDVNGNKVDIFIPEPPGPPSVESIFSQSVTPTSVQLKARVDPTGEDTHVLFQYGTVNCVSSPSSCTTAPAPPGVDIGSGFEDKLVSVNVSGLQPGTTYYFRALAENKLGKSERSGILNTMPSPVGLLPDHRAWEMVSPAEKFGASIEGIGGSSSNSAPDQGPIQASEDGSAITYIATGPVVPEPEGNRAFEATQVISTRTASEWSEQDIVTPHYQGEGLGGGEPSEYLMFSGDLSLAFLQPFTTPVQEHHYQEPPLVPGVEREEAGIYLRDNATCQANPATCYQPFVTAENDTAAAKEEWGGKLKFLSGTPDLSHGVFKPSVALTSSSPPEGHLYERAFDKPAKEQLQLVDVLPNGEPELPGEAALGFANGKFGQRRNAISSDGSLVFWSDEAGDRLYVRDTSAGETLQLNATQEGLFEPPEAPELDEVHFQTASSDGSRVFFTDTLPLNKESTLTLQEEGPADLYECDLIKVGGKLACHLTDLTVPHSGGGESAEVVGVMPGASEDGSTVYFVADAVLGEGGAEGATRGTCKRPNNQREEGLPGATCNLYVEHFNGTTWEQPKLVAVLSEEDRPDWDFGGRSSLTSLTSRVSPNGRFLAFMSSRSLTGYDNTDARSGAADQEVYLYDASTEHVVCASCNPSGAQPVGVFDTEEAGEGSGLLVDRPGVWRGHWLAGNIPGWTGLESNVALYQSRYLSDSGRLFYNSADALVSQDHNGKEDVYQYEPTGVGGCESSAGCVALLSSGNSAHESAFLDASVSGNDAFFLTNEQLVAADRDPNFDAYDARVCSQESPCLTSPAASPRGCESSDTCRPAPALQPGFAPPASTTFSGPGNVTREQTSGKGKKTTRPTSRAQKLSKALKSCRKRYRTKSKRKKRAACERRARKQFGPKKASSHSKKGKR
jgi:hypothetical protein